MIIFNHFGYGLQTIRRAYEHRGWQYRVWVCLLRCVASAVRLQQLPSNGQRNLQLTPSPSSPVVTPLPLRKRGIFFDFSPFLLDNMQYQ